MKRKIMFAAIIFFITFIVIGSANVDTPKSKDVREKYEVKLLETEGVVGVSHNEKTNEVILYLKDEKDKDKTPSELDTVKVKKIVTGEVKTVDKLPEAITSVLRTAPARPIYGGISVGNPYVTAGTIGLVTQNGYILSNSHVLALNGFHFLSLNKPIPIYQPGVYDGGNAANTVGYLYKYIPIKFGSTTANNYADAAIATTIVSNYSDAVLDKYNTGLYYINGVTTVNIGDDVRKSGRTTGVTNNTVIDTLASVKVSGYGGKWAVFKDQIIVNQPFLQGGDSGSAVDKNNQFVGLAFAASNTIAVVCKQQYIVSGLDVII